MVRVPVRSKADTEYNMVVLTNKNPQNILPPVEALHRERYSFSCVNGKRNALLSVCFHKLKMPHPLPNRQDEISKARAI